MKGVPGVRLPAALVAACAVGAYLATLSHGLVWDDRQLVASLEHNPFPAFLRIEFLQPGSGYYRPLALASLWLDSLGARIFPGSYHLTNVLLHAGNSLLVLRLLGRLLPPAGALFGGLLFALHPAAAEPVSFVSGRTDLWAALFVLLLANGWLAARGAPPGETARRWPAWAGLLVCAGLAKETALVLPAVLLAWDALLPLPPGAPPSWWRRNAGVLAAAAAAALILAALRLGVAGVGFAGGVAKLGAGEQWAAVGRLSLVPAVLATYARILVFPWPLAAFYTEAQVRLGLAPAVAAAVLAGGAALVAGRGNGRLGLLGTAWLAAFLAPASGLVRLSGAVVAERYLYLPLVGFALVAGALSAAAARGRHRSLARAAAPAVLLVFALLTVRQSRVWRDEITLFEHTLRFAPDATAVRLALSESYLAAGRVTESHRLRGEAYLRLGYHAQAIRSFEQAIGAGRAAPGDLERLGRALRLGGRPAEAERALREALRSDPAGAEASRELGALLVQAGRGGEAIPLLQAAAARLPGDAEVFNNLGVALRSERRWGEAVRAGEQAARLNPHNPRVRFNLALSYAAAGDRAAAEREGELVGRLDASLGEALKSRIR